jgi:hypothetical protein
VTELNENALLEFFEKQVKKSGHSLENRVEDILQQNYIVDREVPYIDKDESKGRYIDLVAHADVPNLNHVTKNGKYVVGQIIFTIECKNLPDHGWVFFKTKQPELVFPDKVTIADDMPIEIIENDPTRYYTPIKPIPQLFCASGYDEYIFDNGKPNQGKKSNTQTNNLYCAVNTVTKATRYQVEKMRDLICNNMLHFIGTIDKITTFAIVQPLIVFEGQMYGATLEGEETKLEPIRFAQIQKRYVSSNYDEINGMIHIVSYKSLPEYLNLICNYYWFASNKMMQDQDSLLVSISEIVDYRQRRMHAHRNSCMSNFRKIIEYTHGKPFVGKINEIRNPMFYLYKSKLSTAKCRYDMNRVPYTREFNYCFNCGRRNTPANTSNDESYCCMSFNTAKNTGAIEVVKNKSTPKYLINLVPDSQYLDTVKSKCTKIVEQAGFNWCPFCGISLEEGS